MVKNVGRFDRIFRIVVGLAIIVVGIIYKSWWGAIGLIPLVTGLASRCLLYLPFGLSTCKVKAK